MRHDLAYLKRLSREIDMLAWEGPQLMADPDRYTLLVDLRNYFIYLTFDALDDPELARELIGSFEQLEARADTHRKFFSALGQLLTIRHEIARLPGEQLSREAFERSFKRTAEKLGL